MKERFDLENFPTSESAKRQLGYVSEEFYERSYVGKWLYQVMGLEYDEARKIVEALPNQMFPETATWGLMYHEIKWQLPVRPNLSYEERRKLIYQKRDYRMPMTPYRMENHLKDITDFEVYVSDIHDRGEFYVENYIFNGAWLFDGSVTLDHAVAGFPHPNIFRVVFIGEGTLNVKRVKKTLDRIKQSHTVYILCEWVIVIFDNTKLEKVEFRKLELQIWAPFFMYRVLNGSWALDGSVNLGQKVICDLNAGIIVGPVWLFFRNRVEIGNSIGFFVYEWMVNTSSIGLKAEIAEEFSNRCTGADIGFWTSWKEEVKECFVIIKQNLWLLDGAEQLDGTRCLNAVRREESL